MQRKVGIIDLGSNTSRLIILAYPPSARLQRKTALCYIYLQAR